MKSETRTVYWGTCHDRSVPPREGFRECASHDRQEVIDWLAIKAETGHERLTMRTTTYLTQEFDPEDLLTS